IQTDRQLMCIVRNLILLHLVKLSHTAQHKEKYTAEYIQALKNALERNLPDNERTLNTIAFPLAKKYLEVPDPSMNSGQRLSTLLARLSTFSWEKPNGKNPIAEKATALDAPDAPITPQRTQGK